MSDRRRNHGPVALVERAAESERELLAVLLETPEEAIDALGSRLHQGLFFTPRGQVVFAAFAALRDRGAWPSVQAITEQLGHSHELASIGGAEAVTDIMLGSHPTLSGAGNLVSELQHAEARRLALRLQEPVDALIDDPTATAEDIAAKLSQNAELIQACHDGRKRGALPEIIDAANLLALPLETPEEIIGGLLHRAAKMVLGGGSKSYKTWILLHLAYCIATGRDWLGFATKQGRVLYVNLEIQTGFFGGRLSQISKAAGGDVSAGQLDLWNLRGHAADLSKMVPQIVERVAQRYALIIIDPIYKTLGGRDENAAGDITGLLNELERLAVQSNAAVVFGAHFSKGNQAAKESIDRIGGSGVYARDPDSILVLTKHEEDDAFTVDCTLRNHAPVEPFVVRWQFPLMQRDGTLDPAKLKQMGGRPRLHSADELLEVLADHELSAGEWASAADEQALIKLTKFKELKRELLQSGRIAQSKLNGKFYKVGKVGK